MSRNVSSDSPNVRNQAGGGRDAQRSELPSAERSVPRLPVGGARKEPSAASGGDGRDGAAQTHHRQRMSTTAFPRRVETRPGKQSSTEESKRRNVRATWRPP